MEELGEAVVCGRKICILENIFDDCREEGFSVTLSKSRLVKGVFKTVGALATLSAVPCPSV